MFEETKNEVSFTLRKGTYEDEFKFLLSILENDNCKIRKLETLNDFKEFNFIKQDHSEMYKSVYIILPLADQLSLLAFCKHKKNVCVANAYVLAENKELPYKLNLIFDYID